MTTTPFRFLITYLLLPLLLSLAAGSVLADPPGRAGRLSLLDGEVALRRAAGSQWERAAINWPLTRGDVLATEADAKAEVRIGSTVLRLDEDTEVEVVELDDERIRLRLEAGNLYVRVRSEDPAAAVSIETADGVVTAAEPGAYRVEQVDGTTVLSNYAGHLDYRSRDRQLGITEGRRAVVSRWADEVEWGRPDRDAFYEWAQARDGRDERLGEPRHVSPEMTGAEDLYEYGDWDEHRDYGTVWYPRSIGHDWAPYRFGTWTWVDPWGWTWVDDAPWGFAPFHYGRWVRIGYRWAWVPGRYVARPVYAPALVAWIGSGGVVVSMTSRTLDHLRWYPLAPREVYVPYYRYSPTYVRQVNITHITNVVEVTRVVEAPQRVRHTYRDHRAAVTRSSERVLRPTRVVQRDEGARRERLVERAQARDLPVYRAPQGGRESVRERMETRRDAREQAQQERRDERRERVEARRDERQERGDAARERRQESQAQQAEQEEAQRRAQVLQRLEQRQERVDAAREERQGRREVLRQEAEQSEASQRQQVLQRLEERRREQADDAQRRQAAREARVEMQRREAAQEVERERQIEAQRAQQRQDRREALRQEAEQDEARQRQQVLQRLEERRREQADDAQRQQAAREARVEMQRREAAQQAERQRQIEAQRAQQRQERREDVRERVEDRRDLRRAEAEQRQHERQLRSAPAQTEDERARRRQQGHGGDPFRPDN